MSADGHADPVHAARGRGLRLAVALAMAACCAAAGWGAYALALQRYVRRARRRGRPAHHVLCPEPARHAGALRVAAAAGRADGAACARCRTAPCRRCLSEGSPGRR
uniref:Transmembrane protein n=1 Tax=Ralstonia solanacearum TaxID=305 RepID=A0A0S4TTU2_RALSL|nr:protein of unknown function [Ralstonia solanacearum]